MLVQFYKQFATYFIQMCAVVGSFYKKTNKNPPKIKKEMNWTQQEVAENCVAFQDQMKNPEHTATNGRKPVKTAGNSALP